MVLEWSNIVVWTGFAVHLVVDGDKHYVDFRKIIFRLISHENMVMPNLDISLTITIEIFSVIYVVHNSLEIGAVEVTARIPIVHVKSYVTQTVFVRILF